METEYDYPGPYQRADTAAQAVTNNYDSKLTPLLVTLAVLSLLLSGMSLMGTAWAIHEATRAQTRADVAELEVESFKNVLHSRGLPTSAHLEGESP